MWQGLFGALKPDSYAVFDVCNVSKIGCVQIELNNCFLVNDLKMRLVESFLFKLGPHEILIQCTTSWYFGIFLSKPPSKCSCGTYYAMFFSISSN